MPKTRIVWQFQPLTGRLLSMPFLFQAALESIADEIAEELEDYMKAEAPWEDQTGDAREGLGAEVSRDNGMTIINLFHSVEYGIWLEIRFSGQFAIILPTIESQGPAQMAKFHKLFERFPGP